MNWLKLGCTLTFIIGISGCDKNSTEQAEASANTQPKVSSQPIETVNVKTTVDWTPVFAGWQHGCTNSPIFDALQDAIYHYPETGTDPHLPQAGQIVLPEQYKKAVAPEITVIRGDDSSEFSIAVNEGTYHGIKLNKIVAYGGHGNGINGRYIEIQPTDAELRQFFKNVEFEQDYENADEYMDYKAMIKVNDDNVIITCDRSM